MDFNAIISRVTRVFTFDLTVFQEVEEDQTATQQAWAVVVIVAVASAIGSGIGSLIGGGGFLGLILGLVLTPITMVVGYFLWAFITSWVGTNMFQAQTDFAEMQRVIGFAFAPHILGFLAIIPCLGGFVAFIGGIWALVLAVMAVKEGLDVDWPQAIITCGIGWIASIILVGIPSFIMNAVISVAAS